VQRGRVVQRVCCAAKIVMQQARQIYEVTKSK
jgi:hypothetical protein